MTFVRSKNISLKYQRFTTLGSKDIGIRKSEFVAESITLLEFKTLARNLEIYMSSAAKVFMRVGEVKPRSRLSKHLMNNFSDIFRFQ